MEDGREFKITLTPEMAKAVERKVASGEYESPEAVMREGLQALFERDTAFEFDDQAPPIDEAAFARFVREEIIPGHEEYMADPSTGTDGKDILRVIRADYEAREARKR